MGPKPDSRLVEFIPTPTDYIVTIAIGIVVSSLFLYKKQKIELRFFWLILGQTIVLTAPLLTTGLQAVWGDYPTIDKEGSHLYYLQGIHIEQIQNPQQSLENPAIQLIGFHLGHLWITEFFDLFLPTHSAFNAQALCNVVLSWWCMWLLLWERNKQPWIGLILSFGFGMGLHLFRDINWYTIEKSAVWWLPLFWWAMERVNTGKNRFWLPIPIFLGACYSNLYWGMLIAMLGFFIAIVYRKKPIFYSLGGCFFVGLAIGVYQMLLMKNAPPLAQPEDFLWLRAALDAFTISPFQWNRIPFFLAVHPLCLAICGWALWQQKKLSWMVALSIVFFLLSLGPWLLPDTVKNPLYLGFAHLPGMWRFSEPEIFFHLSWMLLLGNVGPLNINPKGKATMYLFMVVYWIFAIRTSIAYPQFSTFIPSELAKNWEQNIFK